MSAPISESRVREVLEYVHDPELEIDIVNLGLVYDVRVDGPLVTLEMTLTSMGCPAQPEIEAAAMAAVGSIEGVEGVRVEWTFDPPWTPALVTEEGRDMLLALGHL